MTPKHRPIAGWLAAVVGAAALAAVSAQAAAPAAAQGIITAREYLGIGGTAISDLTGSPKFPNAPDGVYYPPRFEWPTGPDDATPPAGNVKDNYGVQIAGYYYPPKTGAYVFYLAADDNAQLYLSTDENPAKKVLIASEPEWNGIRTFAATSRRDNHLRADGSLPNVSAPITLTAGKAYYIEGNMKEGGGGDNLAIAVQGPGDAAAADGDMPLLGKFLSTIDRADLSKPYLAGFSADPGQISFSVNDGDGAGGTKFDGATAKVLVDGVAAAAKSSKAGSITTLTVDISPFFAPGSSHTAKLESSAATVEKSFNIDSYVLSTKDLKVTADTSKAGFRMRVFQNEAKTDNSAARAENALAGLLKDSAGDPLPNLADLAVAGTDGFFTVETVINFDQDAGAQGNFNDANGNADAGIPGIPGTGGSNDGISAEILTFLDLPKGVITMGFNSDDGFRTYAGNVKDALLAIKLGAFDGGRGASDTIFQFVVEEAGVYPFRSIWYEGGGGANLEWFTVVNGKKTLINSKDAGAVKAYRLSSTPSPATLKLVSPGIGAGGVDTKTAITAILVDGGAKIDQASITLSVGGAAVKPTVTKSGDTTTVTYQPAVEFEPSVEVAVSLAFKDSAGASRTVDWKFSTAIGTGFFKGKNALFIEAEDFDFGGGKSLPGATIGMAGKYVGGTFEGLGTADDADIDWHNGSNAGQAYRTDTLVAAGKKNAHAEGLPRGDFDVETNWVVGWNDNGDWQNYTREFPTPAKKYNVYGRLSSGGAPINGQLGQVTAGVGTKTQTVVPIANIAPGRATPGWDTMEQFQLTDPNDATAPAVVELGGKVTLRFTTLPGNLDSDWFAFIVAKDTGTGGAKPKITGVTKNADGSVTIEWTGGGVLQAAAAVNGPYQDVAGATSPYKLTPNQAALFGRIKK